MRRLAAKGQGGRESKLQSAQTAQWPVARPHRGVSNLSTEGRPACPRPEVSRALASGFHVHEGGCGA